MQGNTSKNDSIPIVSVCVQTYQHVDFIKECLDSILMQQTNFPFEIILGEDESSDGTRDICIEYTDKHPDKIRLFLRSRKDVIYINGNPTGRFNFIENLKAAKGKYIALCEGDDYWTDPLKLQKQVDIMERDPNMVLCFHNSFVNGQNNLLNDQKGSKVFEMDTIIKKIWFIPTASITFRNILTSSDYSYIMPWQSGDIPLSMVLASKGLFYYIDETMSFYRKHEKGLSASHSKDWENTCKNRIAMYNYFDNVFDYKYHESFRYAILYHSKGIKKFIVDDFDLLISINNCLREELNNNIKLISLIKKSYYFKFLNFLNRNFRKILIKN